uniref:Uncharacterized protein n=1 Tax=Panagrolaimus superbus TaxID=310955 RepID=A0A914YU53_9BILA
MLWNHFCKPSYCVSDLIKIMSMPPLVESIERDSLWQFKIVNDAENPVLLEFDTFEGDRKQASPTFLLAMFLRQQIKVIRAKINSKPIALGFCLLLDKYDGDEKKRIQNQLEEACRLLKIECVFVKFF